MYGFSHSNTRIKSTRAPVINPVINGCQQMNTGTSVSFAFTEGITSHSVLLGNKIKSLPGFPTAIFFWIDKDFYIENDVGYVASLIEAGHAIGLRWYLDLKETNYISKSQFIASLIDFTKKLNIVYHKYSTTTSIYYPKYLYFNYISDTSHTSHTSQTIIAKYAEYASEIGFYTIQSIVHPEPNTIENILHYYTTLNGPSLAIHPGHLSSPISSNLTFFDSISHPIVSISTCINHPITHLGTNY